LSDIYFYLQNGISGDMAVAALLDLSNDFTFLQANLKKLGVEGYKINFWKEKRDGITGSRFSVEIEHQKNTRTYTEIKSIIKKSDLNYKEKELSLSIFKVLAEAEAKVHNVNTEEVHFHEVGAIDSLVDIVSFSILYTKHNFTKAYASPVHLGSGSTKSMHGILPVPAPATLEILRGIPVKGTDILFEITTPTGAAIVKTIIKKFGTLPLSVIKRAGNGFGSRKDENPNILRVFEIIPITGQYLSEKDIDVNQRGNSVIENIFPPDVVVVMEVTIDDSTPEEISYLQEKLFLNGALEVFISPVYMKKNRSAWNISLILQPENLNRCSGTILMESSSFGLRYHYCFRKTLKREFHTVNTVYGDIKVKAGFLDDRIVKVSPEYEDCRKAAMKAKVPIRYVYQETLKQWNLKFGGTPVYKNEATD